ncbi:MAG: hypothetical protein JST85_29495 [Acidobacteria bacterium]|nr:hypothetical protein [Acidobacteriota bacterium]
MEPATNLDDAIFYCDPSRDLTGEELASFYVDRGSKSRKQMATLLRVNHLQQNQPVKFLFTGHKGSGKTTEVNKLCTEIGDKFFLVRVSFNNPADVNYVDVPVKAAMSLFKAATDAQVIRRAPAQVMGDLWEDVSIFFKKMVYGLGPVSAESNSLKEITAKINFEVVEFEAKFDTEPSSRDTIRQNNERRLAEINDNISRLSDQIKLKYGKPVLFVFEGLDKVDLGQGKDIFLDRSQTISGFRASAIFLIPIGLRYTPQFATITQHFKHYWLPNIKLHTRNNQPYPAGQAMLREIISQRIEPALFAGNSLNEAVAASGGLIRTLIALIRDAAVNAVVRGGEKIESEDVGNAIASLRGDFIAMLETHHYPILKARANDKNLDSDQETQELLESLALLEYDNHTFWCDVHPIVLPVVEERTK